MQHTTRCQQCVAPAIKAYQDGDRRVLLCLYHAQQFESIENARFARERQMREDIEDAQADVFGLPRPFRASRVEPRINVVNVHGDNHGVINTGQVEALRNNVRVLAQTDPALAQLFAQLINGIQESNEIAQAQKDLALDLVRTLSDDAGKPSAQRQPKATMRVIGSALQTILASSANLMQVWPVIASTLGIPQ